MANNDHRDVELHSGDTVIFSATPVPGNERAVNETIDRIYEIGASVITPKDRPIHASGHGSREEIKMMLNLTKPKYVMPVHGDYQRIRLHAELARSVGIPDENIFRGRNGLPLEIGPDGAAFGKEEGGGVIFVDGVELADPNDATLRDRRAISDDGIVIVVATIAADDGEVIADPELITRGTSVLGDDDTEITRRARRPGRGHPGTGGQGQGPQPRPDPVRPPRRRSRLHPQAPQEPPDGGPGSGRSLGGRPAGASRTAPASSDAGNDSSRTEYCRGHSRL